ncbi:hypothetical protein M441DRAFT_385721 [Trichoderma asperellum CBS 433.97]|uniref:Uncharacterized protein n=1 Tax=Trichoderma asperellum (strain ATCC 204424 / CBS 433.97 / NBRC 101777) TaxID=1042311 RepID=A0A2T3ZBN0_TRIA4|nr:hypothetical protein M441DRAFT_385721 [Trichoderma asperellum CBS 433.97]PTB42192.1 hypothetical protein M441DRAFT_385721 [Trichoderma asperellum CBS 433.97]
MQQLFLALGLQVVLPPEGLLSQRSQLLMRISPTPCCLRICNLHPKRFGPLFSRRFFFFSLLGLLCNSSRF